jgi:deoxyuridine 5'-triphosphate nucleotidohydrolase
MQNNLYFLGYFLSGYNSTKIKVNSCEFLEEKLENFLYSIDSNIILEKNNEDCYTVKNNNFINYLKNLDFTKYSQEEKFIIMRGVFDECADIHNFTCKLQLNEKNYPLFTECGIKHDYDPDTDAILYSDVNLLDFLGKIYKNSSTRTRRSSNYKKYLSLLGYNKSGLFFNDIPECKFIKTGQHAVTPEKNNPTDEGYDITITKEDKKISENTIRYDTELKFEIPTGWHIELYPRSSLSNSGYMLANSVGIVDMSYRGNLKVVLVKVNPHAPDLVLPFKCVQIILKPSYHFLLKENNNITDTSRGDKGFGSSG